MLISEHISEYERVARNAVRYFVEDIVAAYETGRTANGGRPFVVIVDLAAYEITYATEEEIKDRFGADVNTHVELAPNGIVVGCLIPVDDEGEVIDVGYGDLNEKITIVYHSMLMTRSVPLTANLSNPFDTKWKKAGLQ